MACRLAKLQLGRCARVIHRDIYSHLEKVALRGGAEGYKTTFKEGQEKYTGEAYIRVEKATLVGCIARWLNVEIGTSVSLL